MVWTKYAFPTDYFSQIAGHVKPWMHFLPVYIHESTVYGAKTVDSEQLSANSGQRI